jgi:MFS family permease
MAIIWSAATMGSALAADFGQLLLARLFLGVGEAAYGSVGLAVVLAVFPRHRRASLTGAFMPGGLFGGVIGVGFGGVLAVRFGWRWSFGVMANFGLALAALYRRAVSERRLAAYRHPRSTDLDHAAGSDSV